MNKNIEAIRAAMPKNGKRGTVEQALLELEKQLDNCRTKRESTLFDFFIWFRENGERYIDKSIERMITIHLNEKK